MIEFHDVVFDCRHSASLARFWESVLDGYTVAPYYEEELDRLRALGVDDPEDDPCVLLDAPNGKPRIWFQRVPEAKTAKNRVHLDVASTDFDVDVARLVNLGARRVDTTSTEAWLVVLQDPEGNEFCVIQS